MAEKNDEYCPKHSEHEFRIKANETGLAEIKGMFWKVALLSLGSIFALLGNIVKEMVMK